MEAAATRVEIDRLYTMTAYAKKKGMSIQMVRYWIKQGEIKIITINGAKLVLA